VEIHLGQNGEPYPSHQFDMPSVAGPSDIDEAEDDPDGDAWEFEGDDESDGLTDNDGDPNNWFALPKLKGKDVCLVVDKSGVHRMRVRPCICSGCPGIDLQYFNMGLFPASMKRIHTAFTFAVLDDFRMDNLECKTAGMGYWNKLVRLTSNSFPNSVPVNIVFKLKRICSIISRTGIGNFFGPHDYGEISNISNGMGSATHRIRYQDLAVWHFSVRLALSPVSIS
jgi:hypothetical protein